MTQPPQGPEQRREAPADRSGAERGLAPRPRSRSAGGTEGTVDERRCGAVAGRCCAVAASILPLRPPCTPSGAVISRAEVPTEEIGL